MDHAPTAVPDVEEGPQLAEHESSAVPVAVPVEGGLVEEDSLVEEVSIDGMCGVY